MELVHQCWTSHQQPGWGGYVLKEKFKRLKQRMKTWNKEKYGDTFTKFKKIELELNKLEEDTIHTQLSSQEEQNGEATTLSELGKSELCSMEL